MKVGQEIRILHDGGGGRGCIQNDGGEENHPVNVQLVGAWPWGPMV